MSATKAHLQRVKVIISCAYFSAFFGLGFCLAIIGPSLLQLAQSTGEGLGIIGTVFTWRAIGYLCGTLLGGQLFEKCRGEPLLAGASLLASVGSAFVPYCRSIASLGLCIASQGFAMGFLDTGGNVLILRLHSDPKNPSAADPYMNTMHFFFALGAFLIPIIMDLFENSGFPFSASYILTAVYMLCVFIVLGAISLYVQKTNFYEKKEKAISIEMAELAHTAKENKGPSKLNEDDAMASLSTPEEKGKRSCQEKLLFTSASVLLFIYVGAESTYGGILYTYVVKSVNFSSSEGKAVTSIYWAGLAIGRAIAVPLSVKFNPIQLLTFDVVGCVISSLVMLIFPKTPLVYWIMSAVYGLSMASVFPTTINAAAYFTKVDGPAASAIVVGASLGDMTIPLGTAMLFVSWGSWSFPLIVFVLAMGCMFAFIVVFLLGKHVQKGKPVESTDRDRTSSAV